MITVPSDKNMHRVGVAVVILLALLCRTDSTELTNCTNSTNTTKHSNSTILSCVPEKPLSLTFTFTFAISIIGIISNGLLILVIMTDPLKIVRKGAWATIINLAFADLLASLGNCFFSRVDLLALKKFSHYLEALIWINVVQNTGASASFFFLALLTVEAYIITKYPLHCKLILTRTKVTVACTCIWLAAILLGCLHFYSGENSSKAYITWIGILELSVAILIFFKVLVILEIMKNRRSFMNKTRRTKHINIAKTVLSLNIILVVTAFPYFVAKQIEYLSRMHILGKDVLFQQFPYYYMPIASVNFIINPFLYAWRLPDYRRTLVVILTGKNVKKFQMLSLLVRSTRTTIQRDSSDAGSPRGRAESETV